MPSSGVHEDVSAAILEELYSVNQRLYETKSSELVPGFYWSFDNLIEEEFHLIVDATQRAFNRQVRRALIWSRIGKDVTFIVRILYSFSQLKALLLTDERFPTPMQICEIRFGDHNRWEAPFWMYSFALEILAFSAQFIERYPDVARDFLDATAEDRTTFSFPTLTPDQWQLLYTSLEWYAVYFAPTDGGRVAYSQNFTPVASQKVQELFDKLNMAMPKALE